MCVCVCVFSQVQRIPPLESSFIALDTLMGTHETIGVEDVFTRTFPVCVQWGQLLLTN